MAQQNRSDHEAVFSEVIEDSDGAAGLHRRHSDIVRASPNNAVERTAGSHPLAAAANQLRRP